MSSWLSREAFQADAAVFIPLAVVVAGAYLAIGLRYWFRTPIVGISVATACFVASWVVRALAG